MVANIEVIVCSESELWDEIEKMIKSYNDDAQNHQETERDLLFIERLKGEIKDDLWQQSKESNVNSDRNYKSKDRDLLSENTITKKVDRKEQVNILIGLLKASRHYSILLDNRPLTDALNHWINEVVKDAS